MSNGNRASLNDRTGLTATITGLLVAISALFSTGLSDEAKTIIPIVAGIISPFISAGISRFQRKVEQEPELTDYLTAYANDLKYQKKALKDPNLSPKVRDELQRRYSETSLLMATAHQDFRAKSLRIAMTAPPDQAE